MVSNGGSFPLQYKEYASFLRRNIQAMCIDPRREIKFGGSQGFDSILRPFSKIYFEIDKTLNGDVNPSEIDNYFRDSDSNQNGKLSRKEFDKVTRRPLRQLCLNSAKLWEKNDCKDPLDGINEHSRTSGGNRCKLRRSRMNKQVKKVKMNRRLQADDNSVLYQLFIANNERKNWNDARAHCKSIDSEIASIRSTTERTLLYELGAKHNLWLGGKRKSRSNLRLFVWPDGSNVYGTIP